MRPTLGVPSSSRRNSEVEANVDAHSREVAAGPVPVRSKTDGEIAGFVCGILSIVLFSVYILGGLLAIVAIVFSQRGRVKAKRRGQSAPFATAGLVCAIVALVLIAISVTLRFGISAF
jgi:hypothetical protein